MRHSKVYTQDVVHYLYFQCGGGKGNWEKRFTWGGALCFGPSPSMNITVDWIKN